MTRTIPKKKYPHCVAFAANDPLPEAGTANCGQIRTVSKARLDGYQADLLPDQLAAMDRSLAVALGLRTAKAIA